MPFDVDDLDFFYADYKAIDAFSIKLTQGHFYGIIGPNGSGKSTLLDLLAGHRQPAKGSIRYRSKGIGSYSKSGLSREIARVPQNFYINFPFTVEEIVMMGRYPHIPRFAAPTADDWQIVQCVMQQCQILEFADRYVTELSGGERQRVVFARALAQNTPVLMLDEATSNLDIQHTLSLLGLARNGVRSEAKTVVAVLQDINLAAVFCDRLIFMSRGRLVDQGQVNDILKPEIIRAVFEVNSKVYFDNYTKTLQVVFRNQ
jgi:iron complex transport system ATP-binding protein